MKNNNKSEIHDNSNTGSKIEEIRINRYRKNKEIVSLDPDINNNSNTKKNGVSDLKWFKGRDDIRYKIDKKTGEIDEKGKDKWFEGTDDIRKKIDEKIKIKDNKK